MKRNLVWLGSVLAASIFMAGAARADGTCTGTMSGNLIDNLPQPTVLNVQVADLSGRNVALRERFQAGLAAAGAQVGDAGGVTVLIAASVSPNGEGNANGVATEFGFAGKIPPGAARPKLTMSVTLMDSTLAQIDWIGYVNCTVETNDLGALAQDLGFAIGREVGKTFSTRPF